MAENHLEKKHAATPRRRQQARQQGQVAVSGDLTSATLLLAAVAALWFFGGSIAAHLAASISESLSSPTMTSIDVATASSWIVQIVGRLAIAIVPLMVVMMLAGVLINLAQTGLIISPSRIMPKFSNISPQAGLKRIFSLRAIARLGFGIVKVIVILAITYAAVRQHGEPIMNLAALPAPAIAKVLFESLIGTCLWIGGGLFVLALADYGFQRWKFEQDLMMTDEELREELKETEGDPQQADRRRDLARELAMQRGGSAVAEIVVSQPSGPAAARRI
jgi:flagellar biosynthetic protein FlhB